MSWLTEHEREVLDWHVRYHDGMDITDEEFFRRSIGAGIVQSRYEDQDENDPTAFDLLQWHGCKPGCGKCGCSGVPYVSDEVWRVLWPYIQTAIDRSAQRSAEGAHINEGDQQ